MPQLCLDANYGFLLVFDHADKFSHGYIHCLVSNFLLRPFSYETDILRGALGLFAKQIIHDLVLSCIVIENFNPIHVEN